MSFKRYREEQISYKILRFRLNPRKFGSALKQKGLSS